MEIRIFVMPSLNSCTTRSRSPCSISPCFCECSSACATVTEQPITTNRDGFHDLDIYALSTRMPSLFEIAHGQAHTITHSDAGALVALSLHRLVQITSARPGTHKNDGLPELLTVGEHHLLEHPCFCVLVWAPAHTGSSEQSDGTTTSHQLRSCIKRFCGPSC